MVSASWNPSGCEHAPSIRPEHAATFRGPSPGPRQPANQPTGSLKDAFKRHLIYEGSICTCPWPSQMGVLLGVPFSKVGITENRKENHPSRGAPRWGRLVLTHASVGKRRAVFRFGNRTNGGVPFGISP